jgi:hypothetical protein
MIEKGFRPMWVFRIGQSILGVLYFIFMIMYAGPFNGFAVIGPMRTHGSMGFSIFLAIIESFLYMINCLLSAFTVWKSFKVSLFGLIFLA